MKCLLVATALAASAVAAPAVAHADLEVGISMNIGGQPVDSVDVFYDQLAPYGLWISDPQFGMVFLPNDGGFVPYTNGHWQYTDVGLVWISSEPFSWATSHYGRWFFADRYGRWVWMPDTTWGPAWVDWRESADDFGWAPLAPTFVIEAGYQPPLVAWHYCPANRIVDVDVVRYYEPAQRVSVVHREARPIQAYATVGSSRVVVGPAPERLRAHQVSVRPQPVTPRTVGRMSATELQTATTRARERKPQIERENQRRIEATPSVQQAIKAPARTPTTTQPRAVQPAPQPQTRTQPKPEPRAIEPKPQPKAEPRAIEPRAQPQPKPEPRAIETKPQPKPEPRAIEPRAQPQPQPRSQPQPQPRALEPKPQPQPRAIEPKPQPKPQAAPPPTAQPRPAPRPESRGRAPERRNEKN